MKWQLNHVSPVGNIDEVYEAVCKNQQQNPLWNFICIWMDFRKLPFNFRVESVKAVVNETAVKVTKRHHVR